MTTRMASIFFVWILQKQFENDYQISAEIEVICKLLTKASQADII